VTSSWSFIRQLKYLSLPLSLCAVLTKYSNNPSITLKLITFKRIHDLAIHKSAVPSEIGELNWKRGKEQEIRPFSKRISIQDLQSAYV